MNSNQNLPAILLPNVDNAQDTTAILRNEAKATVTDLLRTIEVGADLRFMVKGSEPRGSEAPRITWCVQNDGTVIAAAAFVSGTDNHGRIVSSALVFELSESTAFLSQIPPGLPSDQVRNLQSALEALHLSFLQHVEGRRRLGKTGGEYSPEKKKPRPVEHGS
jgi:hypothetical protein